MSNFVIISDTGCDLNAELRERFDIADYLRGVLYFPDGHEISADLDWRNKNSRSSIEMNDDNSRPELGGETVNMNDYDIVFIGYPIWWDLCPRPVNTFIEKYNLSGKTVIPFATSGGSSINNSVKQLKKLYPDVKWEEGRLFNRGSKQAEEWAKDIIER